MRTRQIDARGSFSGQFSVLGRGSELLKLVEPAATFINAVVDDNGGKVRLTSAGVHGLTAAIVVAPGDVNIHVSAGDNWTPGFYPILAIDADTTGVAITIDLDYSLLLGSPTISLANTEVTMASVAVPPLEDNSMLRVDVTQSGTDTSATTKTVRVKLNTTIFYSTGLTTSPYNHRLVTIHNRNSTQRQVGGVSSSLSAFGGNTSNAPPTGTVDTSVETEINITFIPAAANIVMGLDRYFVELFR